MSTNWDKFSCWLTKLPETHCNTWFDVNVPSETPDKLPNYDIAFVSNLLSEFFQYKTWPSIPEPSLIETSERALKDEAVGATACHFEFALFQER